MKESFKNIIIPVNFSESAANALKTGIAMCKRHGAVLHLLHIKENSHLVFPPGKNPRILEMVLEAEVATLNRLESQANMIMAQNNIVCFYHTAEGPYYQTIPSKAKDLYCDLIIIEKNHSGSGFSLLKTNSIYKVLEHSGCAILTVPHERAYLDFKNVLIPVRPLRAGLEKLGITLPIIKKNNSSVLLFSTQNPEMKKEERQTVDTLMKKADQLMSKDDVQVEKELNVARDMAREVVRKAVEKKSDLIVITATLKKGLKAFFTRDYTQKVIEDSPVPVLSVKIA
ncbi:universal stress protein [Desertivirga xinjiangensis]|uniref:universal stress protein n=1 Tax=Desertivirga xinjiangensis TaxID=539206 RepID=UPI00210F085E|nr:universal stress protein [Pedobacter xinjiangensis]